MSAAAIEQPMEDQLSEELSLPDAADLISAKLPGFRVEILGSQIVVTPPADGRHGRSLTRLMKSLMAAGLDGGETEVIQAIGLSLPEGPSDFAVPDLAVVDADFENHRAGSGCYDPAVFHLVVEVTSSNQLTDLRVKPGLYASVGIPVYVIVDRGRRQILVLTEPQDGEYLVQTSYLPGATVTLPASIGATVTFDVDSVLGPVKG
ncbi:Uma2 family endonuclease [Kitasatospora sp. LaBMicrA B282]|uniref:Uma2 family endonuclease n=1 Tax=Kitasatospora sp. LaBMicrA B282 TaxID=3420949 RepID=UPI003D113C97